MSSKRRKIRVLIVDDSATVRQALIDLLSGIADIEVMATAADPFIAATHIQHEVPDVIILDIEMPRMDGITFLRKIMAQRPIPVILCSSLTESGSETSAEGLAAGAVDIIAKPRVGTRQFLMDSRDLVCDAVHAAAQAKLRRAVASPAVALKLNADVILPRPHAHGAMTRTTERVVCIGASTGGTESLRELLEALPADSPGVVIVQHMPERFTATFAQRLDRLCTVEVKEAADGDTVLPGRVLIAPGNRHLLLRRSGTRYFVTVKDGPLVSRHRPSVNVLFRSAAHCAGRNAVGIIMTGMGDDGASGLLEMKQEGALTIAQDEESCVVFGMPKKAIEIGASSRVIPLCGLAAEILRVRRGV
jgi:two-component system chemotaxis response regulator CheB